MNACQICHPADRRQGLRQEARCNQRYPMRRLAFVGFTMAAQVTGKGPLAALGEHLADPINTTIFSK